MSKISVTTPVDENLDVALQKVEFYARHLIARGVHPDAGGDPAHIAQETLAGVELIDELDREQYAAMLDVVDHAYVLGIAVGLKLLCMGAGH